VVDDLFEVCGEVAGEEVVVLRLHVQPGAGRTAVVGRHGDALKVRVAAPPQGGRANTACTELVATLLGVRPGQVEVSAGAANRSKRVRVTGVEVDEVRRLLDEAVSAGNISSGPDVRPPARPT